MTTYLLYTIKVSICLIAFYLFFILVLRKTTFFLLNRLFLLSGIILSFIIPVLNLSLFDGQPINTFIANIDVGLLEPDSGLFQMQNVSNQLITVNYRLILSVIYATGVLVMFFRLLFSMLRIIRFKNSPESHRLGRVMIVKQESFKTFSFFNTIFLPENERSRLIIEHEIAHIEQFHWVDLMLAEIATMLLWFNPFVVLYKSSVKLQHEYLADRRVIGNCIPVESYLNCMFQQIQAHTLTGLVSPFYSKTIKKRIHMITKNKTSIKYIGFYLLTIPLVAILLLAFTSGDQKPAWSPVVGNSIGADENKPSIYPVDQDKITKMNGYGDRINPITKEKDFHYAIDFAIPEGEKILSTAKGKVVETDVDSKKGNYILIQHSDVYSTFYSHLKSVSVKTGETLEKGQVIGISGSTGLSTGPHLHYEVIENGERVDPKNFLPK